MKPKIGIIGYFGHGNAGDEAMRRILLDRFPGAVTSYIKEIERCDAYIIAGGDLVQGFSGLSLPQIWESVTDEPCYALSLGVRKGWEKYQDQVVGYLKKFRKIYTREQESCDILSKFVKVDGVMPDMVLLVDAPPSEKKYPILLNYTEREWLEPNGQFEDIISQGGIEPVALSEEIFDTKYSKNVMDHKQFVAAAKSSEGVIGVRLHAVVMGAIAGVPVAGISYEDKVKKFCYRYDIPCFEYGAKNGNEIVRSMKKANIDLQGERRKIEDTIEIVKRDLENYFSQKSEGTDEKN